MKIVIADENVDSNARLPNWNVGKIRPTLPKNSQSVKGVALVTVVGRVEEKRLNASP